MLKQLRKALVKTHNQLTGRIQHLLRGRNLINQEILDEIETILIQADIGVNITENIMLNAMKNFSSQKGRNPDYLLTLLSEEMGSILKTNENRNLALTPNQPTVIMFIGINGVGKTTSIAKLAYYLQRQKKTMLLAACDTFRAAAIEQLEIWGKRLRVDVIHHQYGGDPAAVAYDALSAAQSRKADYLIIDTAGRLHTKINLMEELKKIKRVLQRTLPDAPHEILLVLDATTGQNAIPQARLFHQALGLTGLFLAKLDGTAKGGIILAIEEELNIPVKFVGLGEKVADLDEFRPTEFIHALFH